MASDEIKVVVVDKVKYKLFEHMIPVQLENLVKGKDTILLGSLGPNEIPFGISVFRECAHHMELVWIYVEPEFRGMGLGELMIKRMYNTISESTYFLDLFAEYEEALDDSLHAIFQRLGFTIDEEESGVYSFPLSDASALTDFVKKMKKENWENRILNISMCSDKMKKDFSYMLEHSEEVYPIEAPIQWAGYDAELSSVMIENGEIVSIILVSKKGEDINIDFLYAKDNPYTLPYILGHSFEVALKRYGANNPDVTLATFDDATEKLLLRMVPDAKKVRISHAYKTATTK